MEGTSLLFWYSRYPHINKLTLVDSTNIVATSVGDNHNHESQGSGGTDGAPLGETLGESS